MKTKYPTTVNSRLVISVFTVLYKVRRLNKAIVVLGRLELRGGKLSRESI